MPEAQTVALPKQPEVATKDLVTDMAEMVAMHGWRVAKRQENHDYERDEDRLTVTFTRSTAAQQTLPFDGDDD